MCTVYILYISAFSIEHDEYGVPKDESTLIIILLNLIDLKQFFRVSYNAYRLEV